MSKSTSPKKKSDNKSALKSRLIRKKKKAAIIFNKVDVLNDLVKWRKVLKEYQSTVTSKTEVSSLMFLKLADNDNEISVFGPRMSPIQKICFVKNSIEHKLLAKSDTQVYSVSSHPIHAMTWIDKRRILVGSDDKLVIIPDGLTADTSEWDGVERMSSHSHHPNLTVLICGDETVRLAVVENASLCILKMLPMYKCAPQVAIFLTDPHLVVIGYYDGIFCTVTFLGTLIVWNWESNTAVQIISVSTSPIQSLALDSSGSICFVGSLDSKVYKVHLRLGHVESVVASLGTKRDVFHFCLASNPTVSFSVFDGLLYGDNENHCRFTEIVDGEWRPRPLGTFDSTIWSISSSPLHNVIATCSANGAIHLSWIASEAAHLILEKSIVRQTADGVFEDTPKLVSAPAKDTVKLYDAEIGITACSWCKDSESPGLLAAVTQNGHVLMIPCDRQILY